MHSKKIRKIENANLPDKAERFRILTDRRRLLNILRNIEATEKILNLKKSMIEERKIQLQKQITEKNQFGATKTEEELKLDIEADEDSLKNSHLQLNYMKEDLFFLLNGELAGYKNGETDLEQSKKIINEHYEMINNEYKKLKEAFKDVI